MLLKWLLLNVAIVLLFSGMIYYVQHLKKLGKEERDDFEHARTDEYLIESNKTPPKTKHKKRLDTLRWVLLLPAVAGMTALMSSLLATLARWSMGVPSDQKQIIFWFAVAGVFLSATWVVTATLVAPLYKVQTAWLAFAAGILCLVVNALDSGAHSVLEFNTPWAVAYLLAVASGLVTTLVMHKYIKN